jgi:hypothetical protein
MTGNDARKRAYNRGADSRLRGDPPAANPYQAAAEFNQHRAWALGWEDTDELFGCDAKWPVAALPAVREACER